MLAPLLFGVVFVARQSPTLSLELRGIRMENAAPILAKSFGWDSLDIGPTIKNDVILVRTKDIAPSELRSKLAGALNATWEKRPEGWRFYQTDEQKDSEKKIYNTERYKFFEGLTEKAKKRLAQMVPFDEENCKKLVQQMQKLSKMTFDRYSNSLWRQVAQIDAQSPMNRLGYRMALRITPQVWMKVSEDNPKVVFCSNPNSMQQGFPFKIDDLIAQSIQEQNQWSSYSGGEPLRGPRAGNSDYDGWYSLGSLNDHRQPFRSDDFYTVTMTLELNNQSVYVAAYNREGKRTVDADISFYDYSDEDYSPGNYRDEIEKLKKKMVKLQGDAAEYVKLMAPVDPAEMSRTLAMTPSPSLLEKMLHPETVDPLSISAPDVYLTSITTPNVVMVLSDNQRASRYAEFKEERYIKYYGNAFSDDGTWFIFKQSNPIQNRKVMPDRKKLGNILRFIYKNKRPLTLEEQADLAYSLPWGQDSTWTYRSYMAPLTRTEVDSYNDRAALRIYGSMSAGERERASKSGLPFSQMSQETKLEIYRSIFYSQRYESRVDMDWSAMNNMTQAQQKDFNKLQELLWSGIYEEKTFVLPNGLNNSFVLKITDSTTDNLYAARPDRDDGVSYGGGRSMSANELGQYLFKAQNPQRYRWEVDEYNKIRDDNIRLATRRDLQMKVQISPVLFFTWSLNQNLITDPNIYTAKTLPQKVLDEVNKGFKQAADFDKNYGSQIGYQGSSRGNPPPPR